MDVVDTNKLHSKQNKTISKVSSQKVDGCPSNFVFCLSQTLLEQDVFHVSLLACCLEIVIFSYNSQRFVLFLIWLLNVSCAVMFVGTLKEQKTKYILSFPTTGHFLG